MSMKSIETIFDIDTSDKLISALGQLTHGLDIQYLYLNGDGNFTFKAELVEETLTDGSKVTNINLTVQED